MPRERCQRSLENDGIEQSLDLASRLGQIDFMNMAELVAEARLARATRAARLGATAFCDDDGDIATLTLVSDASNFLFRVDSKKKAPFAVRVSGEQSTRTAAQVECEVSLLLALHNREIKSGLPTQLHTPVPLVARDGRRVVAVCDGGKGDGTVRYCVAFDWLAGGRAKISEEVCEKLGAAVGVLHERCAIMATADEVGEGGEGCVVAAELPVLHSVFPICPPLATQVRSTSGTGSDGDAVPVATYEDKVGATTTRGLLVTAAQEGLLRRATACCERLLKFLYEGALGGRLQIVHGDLHMANVMQDDDGVRLHLIDFDGCARGFPAQDLAVLLWALQFDGLEEILTGRKSERYPHLRAAVLRGYSSVRPLPEECGGNIGAEVIALDDVVVRRETTAAAPWPALPVLDALVAHRDLVVMAWFVATEITFLQPRVAEMADATLERIRAWVPPSVL